MHFLETYLYNKKILYNHQVEKRQPKKKKQREKNWEPSLKNGHYILYITHTYLFHVYLLLCQAKCLLCLCSTFSFFDGNFVVCLLCMFFLHCFQNNFFCSFFHLHAMFFSHPTVKVRFNMIFFIDQISLTYFFIATYILLLIRLNKKK